MYIYIYRRGHPQSAAFSLVLLHVRWQFLLGTSAMAMSLLCNHWQFLLGISAMAKQNKKPRNIKTRKTTKQNDKTQLSPLLPPWDVQYCFFFCVFCLFGFLFFFLFFWFLFFWFVVVFLKGWQNNTKMKDLDLTLRQFSHFRGCKLAFDCFIVCFGSVVPLENHVKKHGKMQVSLGEA